MQQYHIVDKCGCRASLVPTLTSQPSVLTATTSLVGSWALAFGFYTQAAGICAAKLAVLPCHTIRCVSPAPAILGLLQSLTRPLCTSFPAAMTNDHKALSTQLEQLLHQLHALSRQPGSAAPSAATTQQQAGAELHPPQGQSAPLQLAQVGRPFAAVDEVSPASPASLAGIQLGDQLCRFGNVTADTPATLQQVAATLQVGAALGSNR